MMRASTSPTAAGIFPTIDTALIKHNITWDNNVSL